MKKQLLSTPPSEQRQAFLSLKTPREVARLLNYRYSALVYHLYKTPDTKKYTVFEIPKKLGGMRTVTAPNPALKYIQRRLALILQNVYETKPVVYGFVNGRNIVHNAKKHKKKTWVLNIDLENFFPSINFGRVRGMFMGKPYNLPASVATVLAQICCFNNQLPQGAPTSPIISNMICAKMDSDLQDLAWITRCFYTRYADDMTFSTTLPEFPIQIAKVHSLLDIEIGYELEKIITSNGFSINPNKTRAFSKNQRQEVTGLTVNKFPNIRRKYVSQIRAMLHAWEKYGIQAAEFEFLSRYNNKHRNPNNEFPSFRKVVKGKIEFLGMVRGHNHKGYLGFKENYRRLNRRDQKIPLTKILPSIESLLTIYTEGPTDKLILEVAWKKLYGDDDPLFKITPVEINPGIGGGAKALTDEINSHRKEHGIAIGLFDRDIEGIKAYRDLHPEFKERDGIKISEARHAAALLIPVPESKEKLAKLEKLWIENLFSEEAINTKTQDGKGLILRYKPRVYKEMIENIIVDEKKVDEESIETAVIEDGKMDFARFVVPNLPSEEFEGFKLIFEKVGEIATAIQDTEQ